MTAINVCNHRPRRVRASGRRSPVGRSNGLYRTPGRPSWITVPPTCPASGVYRPRVHDGDLDTLVEVAQTSSFTSTTSPRRSGQDHRRCGCRSSTDPREGPRWRWGSPRTGRRLVSGSCPVRGPAGPRRRTESFAARASVSRIRCIPIRSTPNRQGGGVPVVMTPRGRLHVQAGHSRVERSCATRCRVLETGGRGRWRRRRCGTVSPRRGRPGRRGLRRRRGGLDQRSPNRRPRHRPGGWTPSVPAAASTTERRQRPIGSMCTATSTRPGNPAAPPARRDRPRPVPVHRDNVAATHPDPHPPRHGSQHRRARAGLGEGSGPGAVRPGPTAATSEQPAAGAVIAATGPRTVHLRQQPTR